MSTIESFEQCCEALANTSSRTAKAELLRSALLDPGVGELFRFALDPNVQFYIDAPEVESSSPVPHDFGEVKRFLTQLSERSTELGQMKIELYGKWLRRVIRKQLGVGVAAKTINSISPNLIPEFQIMEAEKVKLGPSEGWVSLYQILEDSGNWLAQPQMLGIPGTIEVRYSSGGWLVLPKVATGPIRNTRLIEDAIRELVTVDMLPITLHGRFCAQGANDAEAGFEMFHGSTATSEALKRAQFWIEDVVQPHNNAFARRNRVDRLNGGLSDLEVENDSLPLRVTLFEPAYFRNTQQLEEWRSVGFTRVRLTYGNAAYEYGKTRNCLTFPL